MAWPRGGRFVLRNYLLGSTVGCRGPLLAVLASLDGWTPSAEVHRRLRAGGARRWKFALARLVRAGIVVPERSRLARAEAEWHRRWRWGPLAGAYHQSLRDLRFQPLEETAALLARRARTRPATPVLPPEGGERSALPPPRVRHGVLPHLMRRRSTWDFSGEPVDARHLADVLFAGLGVRALLRDPVQGTLPLKLAPSGGARNPIDGYLLALNVRGVPPGAYRYSGLRRDLERVGPPSRRPASALLGSQPWADGAAAVVFLVASFGRSMWKYEHPISYRMVLLEAGHIAQNLLVAACDLGLAAWPSGAISDSQVEATLGVGALDRSVLYAVVLGREARPPPGQRRSRVRSARSSTPGG